LNGCSTQYISNVLVKEQPTLSVLDKVICQQESATLRATGLPVGGMYAWQNPAPLGSSLDSITVSPMNTAYYPVNYDLNGCFILDSGQVTVQFKPEVALNDESVCQGESVNLTALPDSTGGSYKWSPGSLSNTQTVFVTPSTNTVYQVIYSMGSCRDTVSAKVFDTTAPQLEVNSESICAGDSVDITATPTPLGGTFLWDYMSATAQTIRLAPMAGANYNVVYNLNGCEVNGSGMVTVNPKPTAVFTSNIVEGCIPTAVTFTGTNSNSTRCNWNFGDGETDILCGTVVHTYEQEGSYTVSLYIEDTIAGCSDLLEMSNYIYIEADPIASFETNPEKPSKNNPVSNMQNYSTGADSYTWIFGINDTIIDFEPVYTFSFDESRANKVILIAYSPIGFTDTAFRTIPFVEDVIIYVPNAFTPDNNNLNQNFLPVLTQGYEPGTYKMLIFNRWGEIVFETVNPEEGWNGSLNGDGKLVPDGVYVYQLNYKVKGTAEKKKLHGHINLVR
jgi:gliding motility-associated-like protein